MSYFHRCLFQVLVSSEMRSSLVAAVFSNIFLHKTKKKALKIWKMRCPCQTGETKLSMHYRAFGFWKYVYVYLPFPTEMHGADVHKRNLSVRRPGKLSWMFELLLISRITEMKKSKRCTQLMIFLSRACHI